MLIVNIKTTGDDLSKNSIVKIAMYPSEKEKEYSDVINSSKPHVNTDDLLMDHIVPIPGSEGSKHVCSGCKEWFLREANTPYSIWMDVVNFVNADKEYRSTFDPIVSLSTKKFLFRWYEYFKKIAYVSEEDLIYKWPWKD
jgi:hypothetical protein